MKQINVLYSKFQSNISVTQGKQAFGEQGRVNGLDIDGLLKYIRAQDAKRPVEIRVSDEFPEELRERFEDQVGRHFKRARVSYDHFEMPKYTGKKEDRG